MPLTKVTIEGKEGTFLLDMEDPRFAEIAKRATPVSDEKPRAESRSKGTSKKAAAPEKGPEPAVAPAADEPTTDGVAGIPDPGF